MKHLTQTFTTIFALCWTLTGLAQPSENVQQLSENVYAVFLDYYNSLVVVGDEGVLITDPANSRRAAALKAEIETLTALPVTQIVLSHEHYDHIGGTELFPDAEIYAHAATEPVLRLDITGQAPTEVDHYIGDKTVLTVGNTDVELLHYGAADGVGTLVVHLPKESVVFSADMYETNEITNGMWLADSNYLGSRTVLNELVALNPSFAITTHSKDTDPAQLQLAADFYNDLYDAVEPKVTKAMSESFEELVNVINTLPQEVSLPKYENFGNYDSLPAHVERMIFSIFHGG